MTEYKLSDLTVDDGGHIKEKDVTDIHASHENCRAAVKGTELFGEIAKQNLETDEEKQLIGWYLFIYKNFA